MCGIFGAVVIQQGQQWDRGVIRALTWANRDRGNEALGYFDSSGKMTKGAGDPDELLAKARIKQWINHSQKHSWFIAGHTRLGTRGASNRRNAHPFRYGRIIGSHNGMCDAPHKFQVDSEFLFWSLNKARGDYQKGLGDIGGYWGLSWYNGEHFYLMNHKGELAFDIVDGVLYYSSSLTHLDSCTGGSGTKMKDGEVIRIAPDGSIARSIDADSGVKEFLSKADDYTYGYGTASSYYGSRSNAFDYKGKKGIGSGAWDGDKDNLRDYFSEGNDDPNATEGRDYDHEWQAAWSEYCTESEHTSTGDLTQDTPNENYAG